MSCARDACYNNLSSSLRNNFLFSCAVPNLFMCNVGPHKNMQEDIKMVMDMELSTSAHADAPVIMQMLKHRNK